MQYETIENDLKNIKSTNQHKQDVNSVSIFPSEKIVSVSKNKLIIIMILNLMKTK